MRKLYLYKFIDEIDGKLKYGKLSTMINNVVTRSNYLKDNTLFFHTRTREDIDWDLCKEHKNLIVVTEEKYADVRAYNNLSLVIVDDVDKAYYKFISFYRNLFKLPVIAVTGTCGKTTTKEMIVHILSEYYNVQATYLSSNATSRNLPYLIGIDDNTDVGVFETGVVYYPGDLLNSCKYFKPQIGIITNIGVDHLSGCESLDNYIKAKGEMLEGLDFKGTLILNGDDENIKKIDKNGYKGNIIYFGKNEDCDFRAVDIKYLQNGMEFTLIYNNLNHKVFIPGYGEHNIYNTLAALVATHTLGIGINEAIKLMESYEYIRGHMEVLIGINNSLIIDDTWSSNPTSSEAAIKALKRMSNGKRTIALLGKMSLLGEYETEYHRKIGDICVKNRIDVIITIGDEAAEIGKRVLELGMQKDNVYICKNGSAIYEILSSLLDSNTILLVKTSMLDDSADNVMNKIIKVN